MAMHLNTLIDLLKRLAEARVFPCIRELISEGLYPERLSPGDLRPSRQDVTQFLAAWFRHVDVPEEICREWMIPYCTEHLSAMSSSSLSQIRHSTKSNVKYIYKSRVPFLCGAKNNIFKASCTEACPLFDAMTEEHQKKPEKRTEQAHEPEVLDPMPAVASVKETYQEQFIKAMEFASDQIAEGVKRKHVVTLLNEKGFKTRTGRKWSDSILNSELKKGK
jgi:hypothetical protein